MKTFIVGIGLALAIGVAGCSSEKTVVRKESVTSVPAAPTTVERTTTVETNPAVVERRTTERHTTETLDY